MSKPVALLWFVGDHYSNFFSEELRNRLDHIVDVVEPASHITTDFVSYLDRVDCVLATWGLPKFQDDWFHESTRVKGVFYAAGTVKSWACPALFDRNILVTATAGPNAIPVAHYTVAMVILGLKNVLRHTQQLKKERNEAWNKFHYPLKGIGPQSRVGIIGASKIGRLVIDELLKLGVQVSVYDPYLTKDEARRLGVNKQDLDELMESSDVVSLHAPDIPETQKMINFSNLSLMRDGATFINTARGALVDEEGLIEVLREDKISAVLDVTKPEPPEALSPLYTLPNCFLTPHLAGTGGYECQRMCEQAIEEIERFFDGRDPIEPITREMLVRMA
ncbi:MAG: hydroxyacid dehydrogenase [Verrucomicrobiota bacterium]